jgi:NitT/TauT family transport system ATP-binding protein
VAGFDPFASFKALKGRLSVSFQTDRLLPWRTAVENVELGLLILGKSRSQARARAREWLARVRLDGADDKYVHELSGGMRQRVSLARALAIDRNCFLDKRSVNSTMLKPGDFTPDSARFWSLFAHYSPAMSDALEMADRAGVEPPAR